MPVASVHKWSSKTRQFRGSVNKYGSIVFCPFEICTNIVIPDPLNDTDNLSKLLYFLKFCTLLSITIVVLSHVRRKFRGGIIPFLRVALVNRFRLNLHLYLIEHKCICGGRFFKRNCLRRNPPSRNISTVDRMIALSEKSRKH